MKEIKLNLGFVALVDDEDYEWLMKWNWFSKPGPHTHYASRNPYLKDGIKQPGMMMHRAILKMTDPKICVDHKDRNGLNNQKSNLRLATKSQNAANGPKQTNTSKYFGVSRHSKYRPKPWIVVITKDNKINYIGAFKTEEEAALAYNVAAFKLQGEFARQNVIDKLV